MPAATETKPTLEKLQSMLRLPSTAEAQERLANARRSEGASEAAFESAQTQRKRFVDRCIERDAIQATRPDDCQCLGSGRRFIQNKDSGTEYFGWCSCADGQRGEAERTAKRQKDDEERRERREERWYERSGIPVRFQDWRFASAPASMKALMEKVQAKLDSAASYPSWFLWGPYGVGKTGIAISLAYEALMNSDVHSVAFVSAPDMFSRLRSTYRKNGEGETEWDVIQEYAETGLLIIDDLGAEAISAKGSEWLQDRLYQIVGNRHAEQLPIIFTSNLNLAQLAPRIGERITWRIVEMCGEDHIIHFTGPNLRESK